MSADPSIGPQGARIAGLAESIYFGPDGARLFGWLHRPSVGTGTDMGLVICPPFGYEAICSHRAARSLAEAAAELGIPALRFDYLGTGDSAEIESEADQADIWSQDVLTAITAMQEHTGVSRICLVGFRVGALLAVQAAHRCKAVEGLILVAPVISGRRYLRELRTTRLAGLLRSAPADSLQSAAPDDANNVHGRSWEVSGFSLSAATLSTLEKSDLTQVGLPLGCDALVIDGTSFPVARHWAEEQSKLGRRIQYFSLPSVVELMITAPQYALTSPSMVTAFTEWLALHQRKPARTERDDLRATVSPPAPSTGTLSLPTASHSPNSMLTERPAFFGREALLFGIVTEPVKGENRRRAVILLNAGADHHVGPSRVHVSIARRWARRGYFVLRMDLGGIGDSATRPGSQDDEVFPPAALDDIRAGIEFLKASYNIRDIALAGLCSGAYHALRAAVAGMPVTRILLVNPQNFFWKKGASLADLQIAEVVKNPAVYRHRISSGTAWRRLLSGQVNIWRIARIYVWRSLLPLHSMFRTVARRLGVRLPHDLVRELQEVGARGVRVVFVFADGEPGLELLKVEVGASVKHLGSRCGLHIIERGDHVFSHSGPRATLEDVLSEELFVRSGFDAARSMPAER